MTSTPPGAPPHLVEALARFGTRHKVARKLVVSPTMAVGRELLGRLSLSHGGWIGFEVATPRPLAQRLAAPVLQRDRLVAIDAFEEQALLDVALDRALVTGRGRFSELSEGVGFREAFRGSIVALRLADIDAGSVGRARLGDWRKRLLLQQALRHYEDLLAERRRADTATILAMALHALDDAGGALPTSLGADVVLLVPGLGMRGLAGKLVSALCARGAKVLETDPVIGLDQPKGLLWNRRGDPAPGSRLYDGSPPVGGAADSPGDAARDEQEPDPLEVDVFRAASINDELREVVRRVAARGLHWDQVELITPDPALYGSALHAVAVRLGIPVTYAVGLPIERTRTGRVIRSYLEWIEEGFQAAPIRRLIEAGDLRPTRSAERPSAAQLARRFRTLRVGWGRQRYRSQIREALKGIDRIEPNRVDSPERFAIRQERLRDELESLRSMLFPALKATPTVPDRMGDGAGKVSPAEVARGLQAFLTRVPRGRGPDRSAREEVNRILERVEATLRRKTEFRAAVAVLRGHLQVRVRASRPGADPDDAGAPWVSEGGALHVADLQHGGYSGREAVFFVGMDADRVPGTGGQDPVLLDADRRVLGSTLPTSIELLREKVFRLAALFARLRGPVTMSFTSWNAADARTSGPSPVLLHALRMSRRDPDLTFIDLDEALGPVIGSIPRAGAPALDREDVWMSALGEDEVLRLGEDAVRAAYPRLDRGLTARDLRRNGVPEAVHGVVRARPDLLDPRRNPEIVSSPSRLQTLGACPMRYLHSVVLRLRPPDDPELDPDRWLDHLRRGSLLHRVYEASLSNARETGVALEDAAFDELTQAELTKSVAQLRYEVPIPGEGTFRREVAALEEDIRSFVRMVRKGAPWIALELPFGMGDDEPLEVPVPGGTIRVRGTVDRVDENLEGIRVIDYKTGRARDYGGTGVFHGGRRLQHALYALAAADRLRGTVVAGEYHYPTRRGENRVFPFDHLSLAPVGDLLGHMLDGVAEGSFVPTDKTDDCMFCDYREVCRTRTGAWGKTESPLAEWSAEHLNTGLQPALLHLKKTRAFER